MLLRLFWLSTLEQTNVHPTLEEEEVNTMQRAMSVMTLVVLSFVAVAWGETVKLTSAPIVPGAQGTVEIKTDRSGNSALKLTVEHLAKPGSLTPAKSVYIVWVQGKGKDAERLGTLRVNDDLKGNIEGTTPYKSFDLFVTAEDTLAPSTPGDVEVLRGTVSE
jgi:hypothetical protein